MLKQAGVVDSGGTGLTIIYRGMLAALTGEPVEVDVPTEGARAAMPGEFVDDHDSLEEITFGYCTEFIVSHPRPGNARQRCGATAQAPGEAGRLRAGHLRPLRGESARTHQRPSGKALQYALELGELDAIKIDNMFEEHRERMAKIAAEEAAKQKPTASSCVALGERHRRHLQGTERRPDRRWRAQTMNPSIEDLYEAIEKTHAKNVFVLPNNTNIILAAQQAAALENERNVVVLPTKSVPMGISAALAFDPELGVEENRAAMTEAARERAHRLHHLRRARHAL